MSNWRDHILREFTPQIARLTIVADPDGLLLEEGILEGINERGFDLIPFDDCVAFRYAYELKFRSRWDRGERTDLVVVIRSDDNDMASLPFDLIQIGRRLTFNLAQIFPNFSYPVVAALDRGDLDPLYEAQRSHAPGQLGDNATKEFALRHVFEIAPELIKQPSDLLRVLLRRHYREQRIPPVLDERLIQLLRQKHIFDEWPLELLLPDREAFFAFLQSRWPSFLDRLANGADPSISVASKPAVGGPVDLPFDHHDIRVYIDNLFAEGLLHPVSHARASTIANTWARIGIRVDPVVDRVRRIQKLSQTLEGSVPSDGAKHTDWFTFAPRWAELIVLAYEQSNDLSAHNALDGLRELIDKNFASWLLRRYSGLVNLPPVPPVMLHHIPRFLARQMIEASHPKVAMLVFDGLSFDQWLVIRTVLESRCPFLQFREQAVFAWIPSLTSVSRQAMFAGRPPLFFPNSIQSTEKEPLCWSQFWADHGLAPHEIFYQKGLGSGGAETLSEAISRPKTRVVGLVVDIIDRILHGMELGTAGMHNQVRQWAELPFLGELFNLLLKNEFQVYVTSDHGNLEAKGCGRPLEGATADLRGQRVRVYPNQSLRAQVKSKFPSALEWNPIGLPDNYFPLLAPFQQAFIHEHERTVAHGGSSIEEIVVPLVRVDWSDGK